MSYNLELKPHIISYPDQHLIFIEKNGPFAQQAPAAWNDFLPLMHRHIPQSQIILPAGLSYIDPNKDGESAYIYQAGVFVRERCTPPIPLRYRSVKQGFFASFLLKGAYHYLASAYSDIMQKIKKKNYTLRPEFCIELYLNDPTQTPEHELETQILIPILP